MSGMIDPNASLMVELTARQWNALLAVANDGLTAMAATLGDVQRQLMEQARPPMDMSRPMHVPGGMHRPNGEAATQDTGG
jgi:hypothetical protein